MEKQLITQDIIDKSFEIMNNLEVKYEWGIMIQNSADVLGLPKTELERAIIISDSHKWDKEHQKYIKNLNS